MAIASARLSSLVMIIFFGGEAQEHDEHQCGGRGDRAGALQADRDRLVVVQFRVVGFLDPSLQKGLLVDGKLGGERDDRRPSVLLHSVPSSWPPCLSCWWCNGGACAIAVRRRQAPWTPLMRRGRSPVEGAATQNPWILRPLLWLFRG
jgi:hypothetical protein